MLKVGVTGGIGSGKTTVSKIFELLDVPVFYADEEAKKLYEQEKIKTHVVKIFGKKILNQQLQINKPQLARIVFKNHSLLQQLNAIIHPAVQSKFHQWLRRHSRCKYVLKEAAILIESGTYHELDFIILVKSPKMLVLKRIKKDGRFNMQDLKRRMNEQIPDSERERFADAVILNDGKHSLLAQVMKIHQHLIKK